MRIQGGAPPLANRQQLTQRVHQRLDTDGDGSVSKTELKSASEKRQQVTGKGPQVDIDTAFQKLDADGSGGVSVQEFQDVAERLRASRSGPVRPGLGQSVAAPAVDSAATVVESTDPADSNGDGEVTVEERRAYEAEQGAPRSGAAQRAVDAYEAAAEDPITASTSLIAA